MIDLTMGEDPYYYEDPERFIELVQIVKEELKLPIMISPGVMDNATLLKAREKGANFFALYQETYDTELYLKLRVGQSFDGRVQCPPFRKGAGILHRRRDSHGSRERYNINYSILKRNENKRP